MRFAATSAGAARSPHEIDERGDKAANTALPVWIAASTVQGQTEVLGQGADRGAVLWIGIAVGQPNDDWTCWITVARWKHCSCKAVPLLIAEGEEDWHDSTNMRLKADILLEELARRWSICGNGALACRPKMLFDRVPH